MPAPRDHELCFGCQQTRANHPNNSGYSGCQQFHRDGDTLPVPSSDVEEKPPADSQEEGPQRDDDGRPSQAEGKGEMVRRYGEQHLCVGCNHVEVCEVGRHTSELFRDGWYVVISDCNTFEEGQ